MADHRLKRKGSNRRSSKRRRRRKSTLSDSSYGARDEDEDSILKMLEDENVDDMEINNNNDVHEADEGEDGEIEKGEMEGGRNRGKDRGIDEEQIVEKINHCKELIANVKTQTWKMSRKMAVHRKAMAFVEKFEGKLSRSKGYQQRGKNILNQLMRTWKNWVASIIPWEMKIKRIESHFGSVVASYFVFLRWLLWISIWLAVLPTCFIIVPELLVGEAHGSSVRKQIPDNEKETAYDLKTIWNADGIMKYSILFYGYYGNAETIGQGYRLPLAYLLTSLAAFAYSFVVVLKTMANNSRQSRLSNKDEEFTFAWKLFTEWDYMIGSHDTATTKHASIMTTFKETILEEQEKAREGNKWFLFSLRISANVIIVLLLALSTYVIQLFVERSRELDLKKSDDPDYEAGFWEENELTVIMTLISTIFPNVLDLISLMEKYHPRTSLRLMLGRIFILNLLNVYTLFIALYNKQNDLLSSLNSSKSNTNCSAVNQNQSGTEQTTISGIAGLDPTVNDPGNGLQNGSVKLCSNDPKELCWETMIGQEVFKLTIMDIIFVLGQIIVIDVGRTFFIKYCNTMCCWDLEKTFPEYPDFKTAENLLHLISNQGNIWLGAFFAPGLPLLNVIKLLIMVYARCWCVLVFNAPQQRIFRASRSNNFYYALLLIMLFLCMLPPLFAIVVIEPSPQCGPFSGRDRIYHVLTETMEKGLPSSVNSVIEYAASPGVILPLFMLLGMTIYYLISVGRSLKDANNELRMQLEYERTEGRRKVYAMADAKNEININDTKGWGAAKSRFLKPEGKGRLAESVLSLIENANDPPTKSEPKKLVMNAGKKSMLSLVEALRSSGREPPPVAKKPAQAMVNKLKAKRTPGIPVAVIKGEQSVKANAPAARERNKQAARSSFRTALLDYAKQQNQSNNPGGNERNNGKVNNRQTAGKQDIKSIFEIVSRHKETQGAEVKRQNDKTGRVDMNHQGKNTTGSKQDSKNGKKISQRRDANKNIRQTDEGEANSNLSKSLEQARKRAMKIEEENSRHTNGASATDIRPRVSTTSDGPRIDCTGSDEISQDPENNENMPRPERSASPERMQPNSDRRRQSKNQKNNERDATGDEKVDDLRRRFSTSSFIDENGHLKPYDEISEDEEGDGDDNEDESTDDEKMIARNFVASDIQSNEDSENERETNNTAQRASQNIGPYPKSKPAVDKSRNRKQIQTPDPKVQKTHSNNQRPDSKSTSKVPSRIGIKTPLAMALQNPHKSKISTKGKRQNPKSHIKQVEAHVELVNESQNNTRQRRTRKPPSTKPKRVLERASSNGSMTGPLPEIKVEDFSSSAEKSPTYDQIGQGYDNIPDSRSREFQSEIARKESVESEIETELESNTRNAQEEDTSPKSYDLDFEPVIHNDDDSDTAEERTPSRNSRIIQQLEMESKMAEQLPKSSPKARVLERMRRLGQRNIDGDIGESVLASGVTQPVSGGSPLREPVTEEPLVDIWSERNLRDRQSSESSQDPDENFPGTLHNISADNISDSNSIDPYRANWGRLRRDRPSLIPVGSDDEDLQHDSRDGVFDYDMRLPGRPRQVTEEIVDIPRADYFDDSPAQSPLVLNGAQNGNFTIFAITNGNLDLSPDDGVREAGVGDNEGGANRKSKRDGQNEGNSKKSRSSGISKLMQKLQNKN